MGIILISGMIASMVAIPTLGYFVGSIESKERNNQ